MHACVKSVVFSLPLVRPWSQDIERERVAIERDAASLRSELEGKQRRVADMEEEVARKLRAVVDQQAECQRNIEVCVYWHAACTATNNHSPQC